MSKMRKVFAKKTQEVDGETMDAVEDMIDDEPPVQRIGGRKGGSGSKRSPGPPKTNYIFSTFKNYDQPSGTHGIQSEMIFQTKVTFLNLKSLIVNLKILIFRLTSNIF